MSVYLFATRYNLFNIVIGITNIIIDIGLLVHRHRFINVIDIGLLME